MRNKLTYNSKPAEYSHFHPKCSRNHDSSIIFRMSREGGFLARNRQTFLVSDAQTTNSHLSQYNPHSVNALKYYNVLGNVREITIPITTWLKGLKCSPRLEQNEINMHADFPLKATILNFEAKVGGPYGGFLALS